MSFAAMKRRIAFDGGPRQQDRMKRDRERSLKYAEKYSYQAAHFRLFPKEKHESFTGVFNPVSHNLQFDTKMISTQFRNGLRVGSVFFWEEVPSYWLCYAQDMTDLAFFRGECRLCNYSIRWVDGDRRVNETYAAVIGSSQASIGYQQSSQAVFDTADGTITIMVTDNSNNRKYFNQNQYFIIRGIKYKIQSVDNLSMFGIIKMSCKQHYTNQIDDDVEDDTTNVWNVQPVFNHFPDEDKVVGKSTIYPLFPEEYRLHADFGVEGSWHAEDVNVVGSVDPKTVVKIEYDTSDNRHCRVTWTNRNHGNFILKFKDNNNVTICQRHINVDPLY